jgi:uncharacterized protein YdhG (YjbR/CyaY superfamily)
MKERFGTIDEYLEARPGEIRAVLEKVRRTIRAAAPGAVERISYQMPAFAVEGKTLIYFAAYKDHIGIYPVPSSGPDGLQKELRPYIKGKGTIRLPLDLPIPYDLVKKIALALAGEAKAAATARKAASGRRTSRRPNSRPDFLYNISTSPIRSSRR